MHNRPTTRAEAEKWRYGNPTIGSDRPYDPTRCAEEVNHRMGRWISSGQCSRKPGRGPDGLYCAQHAARFKKTGEIWWQVGGYVHEPHPVTVISHTNKSLLVASGGRVPITSRYHRHFRSWEEAVQWMLSRARRKLDAAQKEVKRLEALRPPKKTDGPA